MDLDYKEIGKRIARRRKMLNLTQAKAEEMSDIGYGYLTSIERGVSIPSTEVVMRLALALDTTPDEFLVGTSRHTSEEWKNIAELLRPMDEKKLAFAKNFLTWLTETAGWTIPSGGARMNLEPGSRFSFRPGGEGVVLLDPLLDIGNRVGIRAGAADDLSDAGVDNQAAAHGAGGGVGKVLSGGGVLPGEVEGAAHHIPAGGGNDGVGLGMDGAAEFIAFAPGDIHQLPGAAAHIHAVFAPSGRAVVAGGDDLVIFYDNRAVAAAQAGCPADDGFGNIEVIVFFAYAGHLVFLAS